VTCRGSCHPLHGAQSCASCIAFKLTHVRCVGACAFVLDKQFPNFYEEKAHPASLTLALLYTAATTTRTSSRTKSRAPAYSPDAHSAFQEFGGRDTFPDRNSRPGFHLHRDGLVFSTLSGSDLRPGDANLPLLLRCEDTGYVGVALVRVLQSCVCIVAINSAVLHATMLWSGDRVPFLMCINGMQG
jgi:hypothetical protein